MGGGGVLHGWQDGGATGNISSFPTSRDGELSPAKKVLRWE